MLESELRINDIEAEEIRNKYMVKKEPYSVFDLARLYLHALEKASKKDLEYLQQAIAKKDKPENGFFHLYSLLNQIEIESR
jgi:hypothetical protein